MARPTSIPADASGVAGRGRLVAGGAADVLLIDESTLATPDAPRYVEDMPAGSGRFVTDAAGYEAVVVNGEVLLDHGKWTGATPGHILRGAAARAAGRPRGVDDPGRTGRYPDATSPSVEGRMHVDDMILVSVDDHVVEPPDLFERHLPAKYQDLAPQFVHQPDGTDAWAFEGPDPQRRPQRGGRPPARGVRDRPHVLRRAASRLLRHREAGHST